jgi:hypothetical protein
MKSQITHFLHKTKHLDRQCTLTLILDNVLTQQLKHFYTEN